MRWRPRQRPVKKRREPARLGGGIDRVLGELGWHPDAVVGHSLGEYGACVAAGVMDFPSALRTVAQRGTAMASTTIPIPPYHWVIWRYMSVPRPGIEKSVSAVEPVALKPEADSKMALTI